MSEKKSAQRWNHHPLISTVLWMLGSEGTETPESQASSSSQTKLNVVWKDQQGGSINEYITQIQHAQHREGSSRSESDQGGVQLYPRTFHAHENHGDSYHSERGRSSDQFDIVNESPQWGFYVPITPPQQDVFPALSKEVPYTLQHDKRKHAQVSSQSPPQAPRQPASQVQAVGLAVSHNHNHPITTAPTVSSDSDR